MVRSFLQVWHVIRQNGLQLVDDPVFLSAKPLFPRSWASITGYVRVYGNCPPLETGVLVHITFKDLERDALLPKTLREHQPANSSSDDEDVHRYFLWLV
jgi:hypothetical protein